ncbi:hypothetical protein C8R44DRAFT_878932 [Mycena epipterygia]|nr:hypothetical protein C8R44DRAFT_878932 [Mycena epipterygia]
MPVYCPGCNLSSLVGMGLWIGLLIHDIAAEFYINMTETNKVRIEYALEPIDFSEDPTKHY